MGNKHRVVPLKNHDESTGAAAVGEKAHLGS